MLKLHKFIDQAYNTLLKQETSVILLHPDSRYRSLLLAKLLSDESVKTFYYALDPDDVSVKTFTESITRSLANQFPTFGRHLNIIQQEVFENFYKYEEQIINTYVKEISELSTTPFYFLLDEFDRADDADDISRLIQRIADKLPSHCKLILNSRTLPRLPWIAMVAKYQASMLIDDVLMESNFYSKPKTEKYDVFTYTLGPGQVRLGNTLIDEWEGHLPRLLLFFALDRPIVTRSEICHAFWPELEEEQAVNVFHVTKRRLHKALEQDMLVHSDTHYQVNPKLRVYHDVIEFSEHLMAGRSPENKNQYDSWKKVIDLYIGPFLQGHNEQWVAERRLSYRIGYIEAVIKTAQHWIDKNNPEMGLRFYEQAITEDYHREDVHRMLMMLLTKLGRRSEAVAHYQKLEKTMILQDIRLSPESQRLYQEIII
jgi:DNA-binding SARP family transcriptional activator